jgi:hypothetical protein|tara:strand:+ start:739 stop:975 length:237 start_codon:yes stop_codon:yes gene_type:complete
MQSSKISKIADRIVKEDNALFDALLEFEKTKKIRTKTRLNFTVNKGLASKFKKVCRDKGYNMSAKIEQSMRNLVEKEK